MDNDSDEYEECNYDYDYEYDYDYDNEEFLLNIETMFNNALISKDKEKSLLNIIDLCQNVKYGKIWEYQAYEQLVKDSLKSKNVEKYKIYFEKLFSIYSKTYYYKKKETISQLFNEKQYSLSLLSDVVNYSLKIFRKLNQPDNIIEIINVLKNNYLFYLKEDGNIHFYIIRPNINLKNINLMHIDLKFDEEPKNLIEIKNEENQTIFFLGDLYALVKYKNIFKNEIFFYNLQNENIFQIEAPQIIINLELIKNYFGYYSTKVQITFYNIYKQEIKNSIFFNYIHYTKVINEKYIFSLIHSKKHLYLAIISKVNEEMYQTQIKLELYSDLFSQYYTTKGYTSCNIFKYFFHNLKPYFTENKEEQNNLFIFNKKFLLDDFFYYRRNGEFKSFNYFRYYSDNDEFYGSNFISFYKVLILENYILAVINQIIFIFEKNTFKLINKIDNYKLIEIFSSKNDCIIVNEFENYIKVFKIPELKLLYNYKISFSLFGLKKNDELNLTQIINKNKCVYVKKNNLLYIYFLYKDYLNLKSVDYLIIDLNKK